MKKKVVEVGYELLSQVGLQLMFNFIIDESLIFSINHIINNDFFGQEHVSK